MTKAEINLLISKTRAAANVVIATNYCLERLKQRNADLFDIVHVLQTGYLIEYHKKGDKNRVLLRGTKRYGRDVLCVVLELNTCEVITCYWNRFDDMHYTLNESAYNRNLNILKEMEIA
jgi:hypothetical protein